jgi:hypothetical protein
MHFQVKGRTQARTPNDSRWRLLQPADQQFALVDEFGRKMRVQQDEELFVIDDFALPGGAVNRL